jgi:hypothetical protein
MQTLNARVTIILCNLNRGMRTLEHDAQLSEKSMEAGEMPAGDLEGVAAQFF